MSCPYSNRFATSVRDLDTALRDRGALIVAVNSNNRETALQARAYAQKFGHALRTSVKDVDHAVADALGAEVNPSAFVLDSQRRLRYMGAVVEDWPAVPRGCSRGAAAGKPVSTPVAKAFGCAIER